MAFLPMSCPVRRFGCRAGPPTPKDSGCAEFFRSDKANWRYTRPWFTQPSTISPTVNCSVYRSRRKDYTYIYLAEGHSLEQLPTELLAAFGTPEFVIDLELSMDRELATEDVGQVIKNLSEQGYHLQLPPGDMQGDSI